MAAAISTPECTFILNGRSEALPDSVRRFVHILSREVIFLHRSPCYAACLSPHEKYAVFIDRFIRENLDRLFPDKTWTLEIKYPGKVYGISGSKHCRGYTVVSLSSNTPFVPEEMRKRNDDILHIPDTRPDLFSSRIRDTNTTRLENQCLAIAVLVLIVVSSLTALGLSSPGNDIA